MSDRSRETRTTGGSADREERSLTGSGFSYSEPLKINQESTAADFDSDDED